MKKFKINRFWIFSALLLVDFLGTRDVFAYKTCTQVIVGKKKCPPKKQKIYFKKNKKKLFKKNRIKILKKNLKKNRIKSCENNRTFSTKDRDIVALGTSIVPLPTMVASLSLKGFPPEASAIMTTDAQSFTSGILAGMGTPGGMDLFGIRGMSVSPGAYSTTTAYYGLDPVEHIF